MQDCELQYCGGEMSAQEKVELLLTEGAKTTCDETNNNFKHFGDLPPFYDEEKFKRGQQFYHRYIFSMFFAKLLGLLVTLSVPSILKLLIFTDMSNSAYKAYKRYVATIFHMHVWYQKDFKPGSESWKSLSMVRSMHKSASTRACTVGLSRISQRDMALTQFGFMGFVISRTEKVGIHGANKEDLEAFIHVWRVIGHIMGIEDRFNICSGSLQETREICNLLIERIFIPEVAKQDPDFLLMTNELVTGMWVMNPLLETAGIMTYLYILLGSNNNNNNLLRKEINSYKGSFITTAEWVLYYTKYDVVRVFLNFLKCLAIWLMAYFPYLAYYKYGLKNTRVRIFAQ